MTAAPSPQLVLASASPRRAELLARLGIRPDRIIACDIDEAPQAREFPRDYVLRMGQEKAIAARDILAGDGKDGEPRCFVLAGDTVVCAGRRILPKAEDEATAKKCLELISGRRHQVLSSVVLAEADPATGPDAGSNHKLRHRISETTVIFKRLSQEEIAAYLASGEWQGKAGGYAIQGQAEALIRRISGSHSSVMGLPLYETRILLKSAGFALA